MSSLLDQAIKVGQELEGHEQRMASIQKAHSPPPTKRTSLPQKSPASSVVGWITKPTTSVLGPSLT